MSGGSSVEEQEDKVASAAPLFASSRGESSNPLAVALAFVSLCVIWGSTYLAIRVAVRTIPPFYSGGTRFFLAGILLYCFLWLRGVTSPTLREWGGASIVGLLLLAGGNGLISIAEQSVASGLAAVLVATVPLWAAVFAGFWERWPTRLEAGGLVLGFAGVGLLNAGSSLHGHPLAALLMVVAAASWAFGSVWSRHLPMPSGLMATAAEMLAGGAIMLVLGFLRGERLHDLPSAPSIWAVVYLIVFGSFVGFSSYTYLLQHVRAALATSYAYVNPVVAVALGVALLGEPITGFEIIALLVVVVAVAFVILGRERTAA